MALMRLNPAGLRRKKNPSLRELRYATAIGSLALGTVGYVLTHRAGPVIAGVVVGMVATPLVLGASVHVARASHRSVERSAVESTGRLASHAGSQPLPGMRACAPSPGAGGAREVPLPASANARKRPTVTSKRSR